MHKKERDTKITQHHNKLSRVHVTLGTRNRNSHVKASLLHGEDELGEVLVQVLGGHARDKGHSPGLVGRVNRFQDLYQLLGGAPCSIEETKGMRVTRGHVSKKNRMYRSDFQER